MRYKGFCGKLLFIDVSGRSFEERTLPEETAAKFLGGNGLGAKLLYELMPPKTDPYAEQAPFILAAGPLNGTMTPMASKLCAVAKSPLTGSFMDSFASGDMASELKYAGYDAVIIQGKSESPVYLVIDDNEVEFKDASHLWGKFTIQTQEQIKSELGDDSFAVAAIGPAGENLVRFACVLTDHRCFGTGGLGAVLGAKNIKAIAVRGSQLVYVHDMEALDDLHWRLKESLQTHPGGPVLATYGTSAGLMTLNLLGALPSFNWQRETFPYAEDISGETMRRKFVKRDIACFSCLVGCTNLAVVEEGRFKGAATLGPEYEGLFSLGTLVGNRELDALIKADRLTDEYGLGQISAGATIAFAMECYERGILSKEEVEGVDLRFGDVEALLEMLRKIAYREGFGDILAEGSARAAQIIGRGSEDYALCVKGMEVVGHSPRSVKTQAVGFAAGSRGATHCDVRPASEESGVIAGGPEGKGKASKELSDWSTIANSLIWCISAERLIGLKITDIIADMVNAVTGMGVDIAELTRIGERIHHLERAFNVREGFRREHDILPKRIMEEAVPEGPRAGAVTPREELEKMLDEYYDARDWDKSTGIPLPEKLYEAGLPEVAEDMAKLLAATVSAEPK